jgi:TctA family transporter
MRYVARDKDNKIVAVFDRPHPAAPEMIMEDDPELLAFVTGGKTDEALRSYLQESEGDLLRILEDLINVLIENNLILLTDFPEHAQRKLMRRQGIRQKLQTTRR